MGYIDRRKFVVNLDLISWSVRSFSRMGGDKVKEGNGGGVVILASCECKYIESTQCQYL